MSLADMGAAVGRVGKSGRSSSSLRPLATTAGRGVNENTAIAPTEVKNPLIIRRVLTNAIQPYRVRGGRFRIATRSTIDTMHKTGNTNANGDIKNFAHTETTGRSVGSSLAG